MTKIQALTSGGEVMDAVAPAWHARARAMLIGLVEECQEYPDPRNEAFRALARIGRATDEWCIERVTQFVGGFTAGLGDLYWPGVAADLHREESAEGADWMLANLCGDI